MKEFYPNIFVILMFIILWVSFSKWDNNIDEEESRKNKDIRSRPHIDSVTIVGNERVYHVVDRNGDYYTHDEHAEKKLPRITQYIPSQFYTNVLAHSNGNRIPSAKDIAKMWNEYRGEDE